MSVPASYSVRIEPLLVGDSPKLIARMKSGFVVIGDTQFLPGYALLLAYPYANHLTDLVGDARVQYLADMSLLGEAVLRATGCKRINYAIYGNLDPFLHAHVWPRYEWEDAAYAAKPPFSIPAELREASEHAFDPAKHGSIRDAIATELAKLR